MVKDERKKKGPSPSRDEINPSTPTNRQAKEKRKKIHMITHSFPRACHPEYPSPQTPSGPRQLDAVTARPVTPHQPLPCPEAAQGHIPRTPTGRTSSRSYVARRVRSRRRWRAASRVGTRVDQRVPMLAEKPSLRRWRLQKALWHLWTHAHRVHIRWRRLLLLFCDGQEDRRPGAGVNARSVCAATHRRVLAVNVDHLSAALV